MRHETRQFTLAASGNAGPALDVRDLTNKCVAITKDQFSGADPFSVKVQGRISGPAGTGSGYNDTWFDLTGALTDNTIVPLDRAATSDVGGYDMPFTHVRVYCTTIGTKPPVCLIVGRNERTDR